MGRLDQLAKQTFAEETEKITNGAAVWGPVPEIGLTEVRGDGLLLIRDPQRLKALAPPWPEACEHDEILVELKMPGDHLDHRALERTLLRRQARQVQRFEDPDSQWLGQVPVWLVAPLLPSLLEKLRDVHRVAQGCYRVSPSSFSFLWIAANELPLREELLPFLVARSGSALVEFARWVLRHRPTPWILRMLKVVPMPMSAQEEFLHYLGPSSLDDDPEVRERSENLTRLMLKVWPTVREKLIKEAVDEAVEEATGKGFEKGAEETLAHQFERRLGRSLIAEEHQALRARINRLGPSRLSDVVLDLSSEALAAWLADPDAT